jgi:hypothetical protein
VTTGYGCVVLAALLLLFTPGRAECPPLPELRDPDDELVVFAQNLKFIATGTRRERRAALLGRWLASDGSDVDLLLLSEARLTRALRRAAGWCFYTQDGGEAERYGWAPIHVRRPPGGLVLGVRQRTAGRMRILTGDAGRRFETRPTSLAEGVLGRLVRYRKGWASLRVDGTHVLWSHAQASYARDPARGAGARGVGRAGQFAELADAIGSPEAPTILTGDLNLLAGFTAARTASAARAVAQDETTVTWFSERTGIDLRWFTPGTYAASLDVSASTGGPAGRTLDGPSTPSVPWDLGAPYDRVGINAAFVRRHPDARAEAVDIRDAELRVSDHFGIRLTIPFPRDAPPPVTANP